MYYAKKNAQWQTESGSVLNLVEGEIINVSDDDAVLLLECGYAEIKKESKPVTENKELKPVTKNKKA